MSDQTYLVFVYGTLKTGERNFERYLGDANSLGLTRTLESGFLMKHHQSVTTAGKYSPDAVRAEHGGACIEGEVFEVTEEQLDRLDVLEGIAPPAESGILPGDEKYYREQIKLADGRVAWAYLSRHGEAVGDIPHIIYNEETNSFCWKELPQPFLS